MIRRLRFKFIAISVSAIVMVMGMIMGLGNFFLYHSLDERNHRLLDILSENEGKFPNHPKSDDFKQGKSGRNPSWFDLFRNTPELSPEAPFETRFFTVLLKADGAIESLNTMSIASLSEAEVAEIAQKAYRADKEYGYIGNYKYKKIPQEQGSFLIFLDATRDLENFRLFFTMSSFILVISAILVFVIVNALSKVVLKPLQESYEKQRRFITDASHEIKTPLSIIGANIELIEMEQGTSTWVDSTKHQVEKLATLTEQLVLLASLDEGHRFERKNISLSNILKEEFREYERLARAKDKILTAEIQKGVSVLGNETYLRQMIDIFLDNALKYSNEGGTIAIELSCDKQCKLLFSNTVAEIEVGNHENLFERFYRADSSRNSATGGHGIGLSLARAIAEMQDAKVKAYSKDTSSIVFEVIFNQA